MIEGDYWKGKLAQGLIDFEKHELMPTDLIDRDKITLSEPPKPESVKESEQLTLF